MNFVKLFNPLDCARLLWRHWDLFVQLVRRNMESRYRGSVLGMAWSIVLPLVMLTVYTFVFSFVFKAKFGVESGDGKGAFAIILFCGMAIYNIFSEAVGSSCAVITNTPNLVKKVIFPLELLPLAQVTTSLLFGLVWIALLFLGAVTIMGTISWTMLLLPLTLIPLFIFCCGIAFFVASAGVYLRDLAQLVAVVLQILFFATPVFYPITAVPKDYQWVLMCNPLTWIIEETRKLFLYGRQPNYLGCLIAVALALIVFQLGWIWFEKTKRGFADVL